MSQKLKNTGLLELTAAYERVMQWFFAYPTREIGLSDLAEALNISKTTAHNAVKMLEQEGFLIVEVLGRVWRISCNTQHTYNYTRKVAYHLRLLYETNCLEAIHALIPNPKAIVLFGSYRKGDDVEKSDIDIAVEVADTQRLDIVELGVIPQFGFRKDVVVNLHIFSRERTEPNLFANIANGIVLEGFLEVYHDHPLQTA